MPGTPVRNRVLRDIELQGGWDKVIERIADGETVTKIAQSFSISPSFMSRLLHEDEERGARTNAARRQAAEMLAAEAQDITDDAPETREGIQKAKLRSEVRMARAAKMDREAWGEQKQAVNVNVSLTGLYLDALRRREVQLPVREADYEVLGGSTGSEAAACPAPGSDAPPQLARGPSDGSRDVASEGEAQVVGQG